MKTVLFLGMALLMVAGCKPKPKEISQLDRKQAANFASEAEFATIVKDFARAEELYAKAAELSPDDGDIWTALGGARRRRDDVKGAKNAYERALAAYETAYQTSTPRDPELMMQRVYVLALLGRTDQARNAFDAMRKEHASHPAIRTLGEKTFERMLADPTFKSLAL